MEEDNAKRERGSGSIYRNGSAVWWIKFHVRGIPKRESSHSTEWKVADRLLKDRLAEVRTDTYIVRGNVRIDELVQDLISEYREKGRKSIAYVEARWKVHLKPFFTRMRAADLGTDQIRRYSEKRRQEGAIGATINRELAILKRAFNLALGSTPPKVKTVPFIPMQAESKPRTGFLTDEEYIGLARECSKEGLWLRTLLTVAYNFAWRKGELLGLRVRQIDLPSRTVRLEVGTTKNGDGRNVKMTDNVLTLLTACVAGKQKDDYVFTRANGKPIKSFRTVWETVCKRAGVAGLLFHDLRRTGVRNLRRLGVTESVAMKISGHKTRSIFDRYDIIDEADIADVAARLDEKQKSKAPEFGQTFGHDCTETATPGTAPSLAPLPN